MNWEVIIKWLPKLAQGATLTLELVAIAVIAGLLLAIPLGIARSSRLWYVRSLPYAYIFFFRGTPLLTGATDLRRNPRPGRQTLPRPIG